MFVVMSLHLALNPLGKGRVNNHITEGRDMQLNVKAFALTGAIIWGSSLFIGTWWVLSFGSPEHISQLESWIGLGYMGYSVTPLGSIVGFFWGTIDGGIGGFFFAWIYNTLLKRLT